MCGRDQEGNGFDDIDTSGGDDSLYDKGLDKMLDAMASMPNGVTHDGLGDNEAARQRAYKVAEEMKRTLDGNNDQLIMLCCTINGDGKVNMSASTQIATPADAGLILGNLLHGIYTIAKEIAVGHGIDVEGYRAVVDKAHAAAAKVTGDRYLSVADRKKVDDQKGA